MNLLPKLTYLAQTNKLLPTEKMKRQIQSSQMPSMLHDSSACQGPRLRPAQAPSSLGVGELSAATTAKAEQSQAHDSSGGTLVNDRL